MATLAAKKSIFEMTPEEFEEHVAPVGIAAKQRALDNGAWFSYKNELCIEPNMFVREFKDGHKELIQLGKEVGEVAVLKVF